MLRLQSDLYEFKSAMGQAFCGLRIFNDPHALVVVTEHPDNQGMSVTNAAEDLATNIVADFGLNPLTTVFFEHWPPMGGQPESFDLVRFIWIDGRATSPEWRRWAAEQIEIVTGVAL